MRLRRKLVAVAWVAMLFAASRDAAADTQGDLEKAHSAYVAHRYSDAEARLRALLDLQSGLTKDPESLADARMYLGAVLLAEGKKAEAEKTFEQLLLDKPDYQPDPLRVSLDAMDALIDARTRLRVQLAAIQAEQVRKAQEEKAKATAEKQQAAARLALLERLAATEVVVEHHSRWLALLPFGVGQFQNGQRIAGYALLSAEALLAVGSVIGASVSVFDALQANEAVTRADGTAPEYSRNARTAAFVGDGCGIGFFVLALSGIAHAELTFAPDKVESRTRAIPPVSVAPTMGPGTGAALRITF